MNGEWIEYMHNLTDDQSNYKFIESVDDEEKVPEFFFNVTYRNHNGYETWEDAPKNDSSMLIPATDAQVYLYHWWQSRMRLWKS